MLPKKNRLNKKEIVVLKKTNKNLLQGKNFSLIFKKNSQETKVSLIVSNKISSKATLRNKLKRLFYKVFLSVFSKSKGEFLFLAKKSSLNAQKKDIEQDLLNFKKNIFSS